MTWHLNPLLSIDTETTGVDPFSDRIVEIAAVCVMPDGTAVNGWSQIIDPGIEIPPGASAVHGISTSRAQAEGVEPAVALAELARRVLEHIATWGANDAPICVYNGTFDWPLILTEAARYGIEIPPFAGILDPLLIDRRVDKYRKGSRKLVDVAKHYGVTLSDEEAHGGLADATAAARVMRKILEKWPALTDYSLATLWLRQVRAHEEWRFGFVDHMRRTKDPDFDVPVGWPLPAKAAS